MTPTTPHRAETLDGVPTGWCECGKPSGHTMTPTTPEEARGMALASALMAANYPGDSGEDVDRLMDELAKRGYRLVSDADDDEMLRSVSEARRDDSADLDRLRAVERVLRVRAEIVVREYDKTHLTHDVAYEDVAEAIDWLRIALNPSSPMYAALGDRAAETEKGSDDV